MPLAQWEMTISEGSTDKDCTEDTLNHGVPEMPTKVRLVAVCCCLY